MTDLSAFYSVVGTMFLMLVCGYVCRKLKIITDTSSKGLSALIIKIAQPFLIINSIATAECTTENLKLAGKVTLLGICAHAFLCVLAFGLARFIKKPDDRKIGEFVMIFANCGFLGFPVLESIYGSIGRFMGGFYIIGFHLFLWSWGIAILARGRDDIKLTWKKIIINYGTVPVTIGLIIYLLNIPFPGFLNNAVLGAVVGMGEYLSSLCTPISLLVTGALIATKPLKSLFNNLSAYYVGAVRLLVFPAIVCVIGCLFAKMGLLNADLVLLLTLMSSFPAASTISMLGDLYNVSPDLASQEVGLTTLLSCATLPLVVLMANTVINSLL